MSSSPRSFKTVSEYRRNNSSDHHASDSRGVEQTDQLPDSIEAALRYFDVAASSGTGNNPRNSNGIAQFMARAEMQPTHTSVIPASVPIGASDSPPSVASRCAPLIAAHNAAGRSSGNDSSAVRHLPTISQGAAFSRSTVERNEAGQVVAIRMAGAGLAEFQYDDAGRLAVFRYADLTWVREQAGYWRAGDRQSDYRIDGDVEVLHDGSIRITKADVTRTLKITGVRIDEHKDGSKTESRKLKNAATPFDLLAKSKPVASVWLSSPSLDSFNNRCDEPCLLAGGDQHQLKQPVAKQANPMFPPQTLAPVPGETSDSTAVIQNSGMYVTTPLPDDDCAGGVGNSMLRNALARVPATPTSDPPRLSARLQTLKRESTEYVLKTALWITDVLRGNTSPSQIPLLDSLASIYRGKEQNEDAEMMHLRALHIKESYYGAHQPELAVNMAGLAEIYKHRRNFSRAEQMYREALKLYEKGVRKQLFLYSQDMGEEPKLRRDIESLFECIAALAETYEMQKKHSATRQLYENAMSLWTEISDKADHHLDELLQQIIHRYVAAMKTGDQVEEARLVQSAS